MRPNDRHGEVSGSGSKCVCAVSCASMGQTEGVLKVSSFDKRRASGATSCFMNHEMALIKIVCFAWQHQQGSRQQGGLP